MSDTTEHRGWEISSDFSQHWMDDPDYELETEDKGVGFHVAVVFAIVALVVVYLLGRWLEPPKVVFAAPAPPAIASNIIQQITLKNGAECPLFNPGALSVSCLYVNGKEKTIRPNYENPNCQREFLARIKP